MQDGNQRVVFTGDTLFIGGMLMTDISSRLAIVQTVADNLRMWPLF